MKHNYYNIPGWFNMHEAYDQLLENCKDGDEILEIGCFLGRSSSYLATNIINSGKRVHLHIVDTFQGSSEHTNLEMEKDFFNQFKENCKAFLDGGIMTAHQGRSDNEEILKKWEDGHFGGIIVDGAHEYDAVKDDILNWWPKLADGGSMIGDDMSLASVQQAVQDSFGKKLCNGSSGIEYIQGHEQWFSVTKGTESPKCSKLIPGLNTLNK